MKEIGSLQVYTGYLIFSWKKNWQWPQKSSQFGHNVRIYTLVNPVTASFNNMIEKMFELSQKKIKPGLYISCEL